MLHDFGQKFVILWGWRRLVAAFGFGLLAAAAMQPLLLWPVLFVSMPVLVWLLDGVAAEAASRTRIFLAGFATGWVFGFGYFLASLYWIGAAFLVEAHLFAWMMPAAIAGMAAAMAVYWGLACALACLLWRRGLARIFLLAALLAGAEWLRGHLLSGFPWNSLGYAAEAFDGLSQNAAHIGMWGLTFFVSLWALAPARLAEPIQVPAKFLLLAIAGSALFLWAMGAWRLSHASAGYVAGIALRVVQPNISQSEKWRAENASTILQTMLAMSDHNVEPSKAGELTHVVWPESSVPFLVDERPDVLSAIGSVLPDGSTLLMGSLRRAAKAATGTPVVYNSLVIIRGTGELAATYDKVHLVPFGEYLPFAQWLEPLGVRRLVTIPASFAAGAGRTAIDLGLAGVMAPLICYEAIFPGRVRAPGRRQDWLLNITNDGWFGSTGGPLQHFAQARFRAIEEGLPLVRAANTGISAVIDAYGRPLVLLPVGARGVIDSRLPAPLPATVYARVGDLPFFLLLAAAAIAGVCRNGSHRSQWQAVQN
ncbi:MAG: apolipoprotein N-acyltransferase [Pseudomonadota bacterium]|nr:apolipoprotein N-acyltransferase [Pseudomonadota bacterium]